MSSEFEILISAGGTKGDVFPLVGVALELKKRNFNVVFQANDIYKDFIIQQGLIFTSMGTVDQYLAINSDPRMWDPKENMEAVAAEYLKNSPDLAFEYVHNSHVNNKRIFLITNTVPSGARLAAIKYTIPHAVCILAPYGLVSIISPPAPYRWLIPHWLPPRICFLFIQLINHIFEKFRWKPRKSNKMFKWYFNIGIFNPINLKKLNFPEAELLIGFFPRWFGKPPKDWPDKLQLVGFPLFDEISNSAREMVDNFILTKGSPLLFTLGSGVLNVHDFFRECRKVCELLNLPGIFVGSNIGNESFSDSGLCMHVDYVDFQYVLPRCRAIIHHGGIGTCAQSIRAGIPQLIFPIKIDQPDNACRIREFGLGDFVMAGEFSAELIVKKIGRLLEQPLNALNLYQEFFQHNRAIEDACDIFEDYINKIER